MVSTVLPAAAYRDELLAALRAHQVVICVGETGSGKTTQLPQFILQSLSPSGRVVVTQPRRVAAIAVAHRVASELGFTLLGDSPVGYTIRFDDHTNASTRLKFVTDGILVRECLDHPTLDAYDVVVLDEAHERSLDTDILLALLKRALEKRQNLRLLVTSATLDADRFAAFFGNQSPILTIPGRVFPVDIFHSKQAQVMGLRGPLSSYVRSAVETTIQIHTSEPPGHILVFLTGHQEIEDVCAQLRHYDRDTKSTMYLKVLPLYGALSGRAQRAIFEEVPSHVRKVIVATNIAETSLTIDGVRYVVDCGFTKQKVYNPVTRVESLVVVPISKVAAQQRAGRAGRTAAGKCFRLYSKDSYAHMLEDTIPEIRRTNLANTVLYLKVLGVHDVLHFELLDRPDEDALLDALEQLYVLNALDEYGHVTTIGKLMAHFPLEPKLARALIAAIVFECETDMAAVVAMLSVENIYAPAKKRPDDRDDELPSRDELMLLLAKDGLIDDRGDQLTNQRLLTAYEKEPSHRRTEWCERHELRQRSLSMASSIRRQLLDIIASLPSDDIRLLKQLQGDDTIRTRSRSTRVRRALCAGLFSHAVRRCNRQSVVYRPVDPSRDDAGVQLLQLHPLSTLNYVSPPTVCIYEQLVVTSRPYMRNVVEVEEQWVLECARGKSNVSTTQIYALSGATAPVAPPEASSRKRKAHEDHENQPQAQEDVAPPTENAKQKIEAARARFLARKIPKR